MDKPNQAYTFDFYVLGSNTSTFVASMNFKSDLNGTIFQPLTSSSLDLPAPSGQFLTVTATDSNGDTSEMLPVAGNSSIGLLSVPDQTIEANINDLDPTLRSVVQQFLVNVEATGVAPDNYIGLPTDRLPSSLL